MNRIHLIGYVGADPETGTTDRGVKWAKFRLATSERWKDERGEKQEETNWHTVVVWRDGLVGVVSDYVKKGAQVAVEGRVRYRKWQDKEGNERWSTEVVLRDLELLGRAPRENAPMDTPPPTEQRRSQASQSQGGAAMPPPSNGSGGYSGGSGGYSKTLDDEIPFAPEVR